MKIYKWVPVTSSETKKMKHRENKENFARKSLTAPALDTSNSNSNFSLAEDSNTCKLFLLLKLYMTLLIIIAEFLLFLLYINHLAGLFWHCCIY